MAVRYHLYNNFFQDVVMTYDRATGMIRLRELENGNAYQMWVLNRVENDRPEYKIQNIGNNMFLTAERTGPHVTTQPAIALDDTTNTWIFPERDGNAFNFTSTITQDAGRKDLLSSGDFLVTGENGQAWRFVVVA